MLFIITFVTSIPAALLLYTPVLDDANYVIGAGADTGIGIVSLLAVVTLRQDFAGAAVRARS